MMKSVLFPKLALLALATALVAPVVPVTLYAQSNPGPATATIAPIQNVLNKYAQSINAADVTIAAGIWSHDPEVSFIHPLGTEIGYDKIMANFYENTMGALFSKRELIIHHPSIHVAEDSAWSQFTWTFHATLKANSQEITTEGRETQIYRKENGSWRIVHVHYSSPPVQESLKGF